MEILQETELKKKVNYAKFPLLAENSEDFNQTLILSGFLCIINTIFLPAAL